MYKNLLKAVVLLVTLVFFVSCQDQDASKRKKSSERRYRRSPFPNRKDNRCPERKCAPCPKDRCCTNEEEKALSEEDKDIISQEVAPDEAAPLDELKASIEKQNDTVDITEVEKDTLDLEE